MINNDCQSQEEQSECQQDGAQPAEANADNQDKATGAGCEETKQEPEQTTEQDEEKDPLAAAEEKIAALKDQYLRTLAEFDNFKKRTLKEKTELILNGGEKTVIAILPVLDDMERALANMEKAEDVAAVIEGVKLIHKKFIDILGKQGVKAIDTKDATFDVDLHEAIAQLPAPTDEMKGKVMDCTLTGYKLNDKVIRHAQVVVGL